MKLHRLAAPKTQLLLTWKQVVIELLLRVVEIVDLKAILCREWAGLEADHDTVLPTETPGLPKSERGEVIERICNSSME